jgi:exopolyphosphatase / guanosine-5'-triphosphate,3'-diphosphate pyrophosphatase
VRVGVADLGSNSTRLLVAEPRGDGTLRELVGRSRVTRLGEGIDATGSLAPAAQERALGVLERYVSLMRAHGAQRRVAVMTSAVRDAANGDEFARRVRAAGVDARVLSGDEEARLTHRGATAGRAAGERATVIDIGGGSTEIVTADGFHVSTQNGVVRHAERHLHHDPPAPEELDALRSDVRGDLERRVPASARAATRTAIAVAGTPTQCAAIDLGLDRYDMKRIEGHRLTRAALEAIERRLAPLSHDELRAVRGLDPARASVIVPGVLILLAALDLFGLDAVTVSERDILWGAVLAAQ